MNYMFFFYVLLAFLLGRLSTKEIYIGSDEEKYNSADIGILFDKEK